MVRELIQCNTFEKRLVLGLVLGLFILAGTYVYLVNQTVLNVVERRALERDMSELASYVADLELVNLELKNSVTLDRAYELGFTEVTGVTYLTRDPLARSPSQTSTQ